MGFRPAKDAVTLERLHDVLTYAPQTGLFVWKKRLANYAPVRSVAGTTHTRGYVYIRIAGKNYRASRLAWFYVHGVWPDGQIDHIDGNRGNDAIANLRVATGSQNCGNTKRRRTNTSGHKGVSFERKNGKWRAQIHTGSKGYFLGYYPTAEDAAIAYALAARAYFGEFARTE